MRQFLAISLLVLGSMTSSSAQAASTKYGVEFSPVSLLIGMISVEGNYTLSPNLDAYAGFMHWNVSLLSTTIKATGFSVGGRYSFSGVHQNGWFAQGGIATASAEASIKSSSTNETLTASASNTGLNIGGGYAWYWTSFYQRLGLAVSIGSTSQDVKVRNSNGTEESVNVSSAPGAGILYNIGWRF